MKREVRFVQFPRPQDFSSYTCFRNHDRTLEEIDEAKEAVAIARKTVLLARNIVHRSRQKIAAARAMDASISTSLEKVSLVMRDAAKEARNAVQEAKLAVLQARETLGISAPPSAYTAPPLPDSFFFVEPQIPEIARLAAQLDALVLPVEPLIPGTEPPLYAEPLIPAEGVQPPSAIPLGSDSPDRGLLIPEADYLEAELSIPAFSTDMVVPITSPVTYPDEDTGPRVRSAVAGKLPGHVLVNYICKELFLYFGMAFLFFFFVFFVNQILFMAKDILQYQVPVKDVARLVIFSLPNILAQSAPMATIVGFLMCLGRMMTDNEVLIFRASGRSYGLLLGIVLSLGVGITAVSFMVNDYLLPAGISSYNQLIRMVAVANPAVMLKSNSITATNDFTVVVGDVDKQSVSDIIFFDVEKDGNQRVIVARKGAVGSPADKSVLMELNMSDATLMSLNPRNRGDYLVITSEEASMNLFASTYFSPSDRPRNPNEYPFRELKARLKEMREDSGTSSYTLNSYGLELNKKFAMPFAALFFAFLALPLAILFGKHNGQTIGLIVGIFLSFLYWFMIIMGQRLALHNRFNGPVMMWLPDVLILLFALFFFTRLRRR